MIPETAGAARHLAEAALRCAGVVRLDDREIATYGVGLPVHGVSVTAEPDGKVVVRVAIVVEAGSNILDAADGVRRAIFDHGAERSLRIDHVDVRVVDIAPPAAPAPVKSASAPPARPGPPLHRSDDSRPVQVPTDDPPPPTASAGEVEVRLVAGSHLRIVIDIQVDEVEPRRSKT